MAKIRPADGKSKPDPNQLDQNGSEEIRNPEEYAAELQRIREDFGAMKFPGLASIAEDYQKLRALDRMVRGVRIMDIAGEVSPMMEFIASHLQHLDKLRLVAQKSMSEEVRAEVSASRMIIANPPLLEIFTTYLFEAEGWERLVRQLLVHHNFVGLEGEDVNDLLSEVTALENNLRAVAEAKKDYDRGLRAARAA